MAQKIVLVADPGIDAAFAIALALFDPQFDVLALAATAGNIPAAQATRNMHILVEHFDPPKWPRVGESLPVTYDQDGSRLHGPGGLGGLDLQCAELHRPHPADRVIAEEVRGQAGEITVVSLGPLTVLARAMDRDPEFAKHVKQFIIVGGAWHEPGNASAVAEFNFFCDPQAVRKILRSGTPITLIPHDLAGKVLYSPTEIATLPLGEGRCGLVLRHMLTAGINNSAQLFGIEGFRLTAVLGIAAVAVPAAFKIRRMHVDVETQGELTRGMSVIDSRHQAGSPNVDLAVDVDGRQVRGYVEQILDLIAKSE
jgi:inosine-uridine nucleoside N-ribohydrolase